MAGMEAPKAAICITGERYSSLSISHGWYFRDVTMWGQIAIVKYDVRRASGDCGVT